MEIAISAIILLGLIALGLPLFLSFLGGALVFIAMTGSKASFIAPLAFQSVDSFTLMAVPFFVLAGELMNQGGLAIRLVDFASALLAKIKSGLGATIPLASMFFGALCGSSVATVAAIGSILIPRMEQRGWDRRYTSALTAASGALGYLIPPSMIAIIYGVISDTSVAGLFLATVIPGIFWGLSYIGINAVFSKRWRVPVSEQKPLDEHPAGYWKNLSSTSWKAIPAFIMPFIILGGIYGGIFTPTEAGAVSVVYALFAGTFIYRELRGNVLKSFSAAVRLCGATFIIVAMVMVFTRVLVLEQVPQSIATWLLQVSSSKYVILIILNFILLVAGMFANAVTVILIMTPLLIPTAHSIGLNLMQLGAIMFVNLGIGGFTPPMALNLFVVSRISNTPMQDTLKPLIPFLVFGALPAVVLTSFVPWASLWLPKVVMGPIIVKGSIGW